jgi:hypothetical protein
VTYDGSIYDVVNDEARAQWIREHPPEERIHDDELPDFLGSPPTCDPATCQHYIPCPPDPWLHLYPAKDIA